MSTAKKSERPADQAEGEDELKKLAGDTRALNNELKEDPRFNPPTPSRWKRVALILFVFLLFWLAISVRARLSRQPKIIYANRYSKEYKYRPAASPIITEVLKDGRTRLRGAVPTAR